MSPLAKTILINSLLVGAIVIIATPVGIAASDKIKEMKAKKAVSGK